MICVVIAKVVRGVRVCMAEASTQCVCVFSRGFPQSPVYVCLASFIYEHARKRECTHSEP